jgi:hypothetical protein
MRIVDFLSGSGLENMTRTLSVRPLKGCHFVFALDQIVSEIPASIKAFWREVQIDTTSRREKVMAIPRRSRQQ